MVKNRILIACFALLLLVGILLILFPGLRTAEDLASGRKAVAFFEDYITLQSDPEPEEMPTTGPSALLPFPALYEASHAYNRDLAGSLQKDLSAAGLTIPHLDLKEYGFEADCFGVLEIPSVGYEVPVYLGSSDANLEKGAAILGGTSLPIGGTNTHTVIAGHSTWRGARRFDLLLELSPGDIVRFRNPWETLTYVVISREIISPDDSAAIRIHPNRDLLSLLTCTHPNTHRVLIICERN